MIARASRRVRIGIIMIRLLPMYVIVGLLKHLVPLQSLARWAWRSPAGPRDSEAERCLVSSVLRLSHLIGSSERDCVQRSVLLYRLLSRAGADPVLILGFQRENGQLLGHAWVIVDNQPVIESQAELVRFTPAFQFGWRGMLLPMQP